MGDQKCIGGWRESFIGHPSATFFEHDFSERVFQQPRESSSTSRWPVGFGRCCLTLPWPVESAVHDQCRLPNLRRATRSASFGVMPRSMRSAIVRQLDESGLSKLVVEMVLLSSVEAASSNTSVRSPPPPNGTD